jgi:SAM-dependent methyltransferase
MPHHDWDESYAGDPPAPWDIGRPQPAFARLAGEGLLGGQVLDVGCGTGEHTLLAAAAGADALGVDIAPRAIAQARAKAARRGLSARFEVADALNLGVLGAVFDTVIDSGLFHTFDDEARVNYVASLRSVTRPGGHCHLMCFSDREPTDAGPRRIRQDELRTAFRDGWTIAGITADVFYVNLEYFPTGTAQSWLADIRRD